MAGKKYRPDWYRFYRQQRGNAKLRGIPFLLTPEEWWDIWQASGHWHERGRRKDQYCMARFGDKGAYEKGNVEITTTHENNLIGSTGRLHTETTKRKMQKIHKGVQYRPHKLTAEDTIRAKRLLENGAHVEDLAKEYQVNKATIYRSINRLKGSR